MRKIKLRLNKWYFCKDGSQTMLVQKLAAWRPKRWLFGCKFRDIDGNYRTSDGCLKLNMVHCKDISHEHLETTRTLQRG